MTAAGCTNISEKDKLILLIGPTGTGKSTFINIATGSELANVNHSVWPTSPPNKVQTFRCQHHKFASVVFVDTPGFDGSASRDKEALNEIYTWLGSVQPPVPKFAGILYFYDVSNNRWDQATQRILKIFRALCGDSALPSTVFVMNFWDKATDNEREDRSKQLSEIFLKKILSKDLPKHPFRYSHPSAWEIVDRLPQVRSSLRIQEEIVDRKPFVKTEAVKELGGHDENVFFALLRSIFSRLRRGS